MYIDDKSPDTKVLNSFVNDLHTVKQSLFRLFPHSIDAATKETGSLNETTFKQSIIGCWVGLTFERLLE